jgi:hypothetical protein
MNLPVRATLVAFAFIGSFLLSWLLLGMFFGIGGLGRLVPLVIAALVAWSEWRRLGSGGASAIGYAGYGALILGSIGLLLGFFGPMIFAPGANQGPMLGIFITGPGGAVLGAVLGKIYESRLG